MMPIALRRATVSDAKTIAAFQVAQGYDYPIWQEANVIANIKAGDHVHIMLAEDGGKIVGLVHWVDAETADGPLCRFVGVLADKAFTLPDQFATIRALSLAMCAAHGNKGRWAFTADKAEPTHIAYARWVQPDKEVDLGNRIYFEGDMAVATTTPPRTVH
jgi:hypothetical protein